MERETLINIFVELGKRFADFGRSSASKEAMRSALESNPWFLRDEIVYTAAAIRERMLQKETLEECASRYPRISSPKKIGVIMAGNIPFVGFQDMLCVLIGGHESYVKLSSKDLPLMRYAISELTDIVPGIPVYEWNGADAVDGIIATGSDNTNRYFRTLYRDIPALLRGSRDSAAVLTGAETDGQLSLLASDIFRYSGLGCRNVSRLFLRRGYDMDKLLNALRSCRGINPKYVNNYRQRAALLRMQGTEFTDGKFFCLREDTGFPAALCEITFSIYDNISEVSEWLSRNDKKIQCVVCDTALTGLAHARAAGFGESQRPSLTDWPDGVDIPDFLSNVSNN